MMIGIRNECEFSVVMMMMVMLMNWRKSCLVVMRNRIVNGRCCFCYH